MQILLETLDKDYSLCSSITLPIPDSMQWPHTWALTIVAVVQIGILWKGRVEVQGPLLLEGGPLAILFGISSPPLFPFGRALSLSILGTTVNGSPLGVDGTISWCPTKGIFRFWGSRRGKLCFGPHRGNFSKKTLRPKTRAKLAFNCYQLYCLSKTCT